MPGLRRHEVADLAGISDTWYTWLEQGRDIRLSSDAVTALARALGLEGESARHLRRLAGLGLDSVDTPTTFDPVLLELLTQWEPTPAYIANGRLDLLACNRAYRAVLVDLEALPVEERNALWLFFANDDIRMRLGEWEDEAADVMARFRAESAKSPGDPLSADLVARLMDRSPEFRALWPLHDVRRFSGHTQLIVHPSVGEIRTRLVQFRPVDQPGLIVMLHHPVSEVDRERLVRVVDAFE